VFSIAINLIAVLSYLIISSILYFKLIFDVKSLRPGSEVNPGSVQEFFVFGRFL
jgi:hypothetical protein